LPESKTLNKLAYTNKPLADQEWLKNEKEVKEEELQRMLERRLNGTKVVDSCECHCCSKLEGCQKSMYNDIVPYNIPDAIGLKGITNNPGFNPVCL
ncbi:unnamed protein product, partial [Pocillopora meandrina]